ncbi:hypothetical protein THIX_30755 [Thiomonas sp. X19]|uniref:hypothetical protein n=1 Tax=Thiomonas sp. X19 TaxID=1050370 RepID=UPI000B67A2FC|nr:hypothetical protein [Thiomonas sp. X19]SCC93527.1 hypothetical protein THIX_30755 [Thiomonas sp. X19]
MTYINADFDALYDTLNHKKFDKQLHYVVAGGRATFAIPVLHRVIGTDDLVLCGAQKVEINPDHDHCHVYPGSRMSNAFGLIASGGLAVTIRQKILAGEEIPPEDVRNLVDTQSPRLVIAHSAASALAIHHATGEPVLCALTPDNMLPAAAYARSVLGDKAAIVLFPDNTPASRQAALLAAHAVSGKVTGMNPTAPQINLMHGLVDATQAADERDRARPTPDPQAAERARYDFIMHNILDPLKAAQCVTPAQKVSRDSIDFRKAQVRFGGNDIER